MDYLDPVSEKSRRACVVALVTVSVIGGVATIGICASMLSRRSLEFEGKPLWAGAIVVGVLALTAAWLALRLSRNQLTANGVTLLPSWFIRLFAGFLLVGGCALAVHDNRPLLLVVMMLSVPAIVAMVYVPGKRSRRGAGRP
jgi:hypothetical protein